MIAATRAENNLPPCELNAGFAEIDMDSYSELLDELKVWLDVESSGDIVRADLWQERLTEKFPDLPAADIKEAMLQQADKQGVIAEFRPPSGG